MGAASHQFVTVLRGKLRTPLEDGILEHIAA